MKKRIGAVFIAYLMLTPLVVTSGQTYASTVIGFESGADPTFRYTGVKFSETPIRSGSGYDNVTAFTGSTWFAFNPSEVSPSSFFIKGESTATFTLESFVIAGAWGTQTLTVEGLNDGDLLFSSPLAVSLSPTTFLRSWAGIDELRISVGSDFVQEPSFVDLGEGQHWALDNLTISAIPEPETYVMLLAGIVLLGFIWRRKKESAI